MGQDGGAVLALKNAWQGVLDASAEVAKLGPAVQALAEDAPAGSLDLAAYHRVAMAQAIAASALRGLVEQLERKSTAS